MQNTYVNALCGQNTVLNIKQVYSTKHLK